MWVTKLVVIGGIGMVAYYFLTKKSSQRVERKITESARIPSGEIEKDPETETQSRSFEEISGGFDSLLLVLPSTEGVPAKGRISPRELKGLIASARYLRCLERDEARKIYTEIAVPGLKEADQQVIQIVLGKRIEGNQNKIRLMEKVMEGSIQAELEHSDSLSPTADLPEFV